MLSKSHLKLIKSLNQKKYRIKHGLFVAEGFKTIEECLNSSLKLYHLYTTTKELKSPDHLTTLISEQELSRISFQKNPHDALAIFEIPKAAPVERNGLIVMLDGVRDPGNLGTIIRMCDWYGISDLICSEDTVDSFNPKVIQSSMGSICRVNVSYMNLAEFLKTYESPVYGTFMDGNSVYESDLTQPAILLLGNEANGIRPEIFKYIDSRIAIPRFGRIKATESLNVATAAAIFLSEFRRRTIGR